MTARWVKGSKKQLESVRTIFQDIEAIVIKGSNGQHRLSPNLRGTRHSALSEAKVLA